MRKQIMLILFAGILLITTRVHGQIVDSAAIVKSEQRIEAKIKDANKHQRKIDKSQKRINKQQKKINRQERKRERKMRKVEREQKKLNSR